MPEPGPGQVLLRVSACGVCRTDLHVVDGELARPKLPLVPGHQIVGDVVGPDGAPRLGVPWLGWTCGDVPLLRARPREPLRRARASPATTSTAATPSARSPTSASASRFPTASTDLQAAPLLCAGLIGYRVAAARGRRASGSASTASAPRRTSSRRSRAHEGRRVFAFTRAGDDEAQALRARARRGVGGRLGRAPPEELDAAIIFAPGRRARARARSRAVAKGGVGRLRRHPHERHPVVPVRAALGRARRCARSRT